MPNQLHPYRSWRFPIRVAFVCSIVLLVLLRPGMMHAQEKKPDTASVLHLISEGDLLKDKQPSLAVAYYKRAEEQSHDIGYVSGEATALIRQARLESGLDAKQSNWLAKKAFGLLEANPIPDFDLAAEAQLMLAENYEEAGRSDSSAYYFYKLGRQIEQQGNLSPRIAIDVYTKLAIFWLNMYYGATASPEYKKTIELYVNRARLAASAMGSDTLSVSSTFFLQGAYHQGMKQYDSARYYYNEYLRIREGSNQLSWQRKISTLVNLADTYLEDNKPAQAIQVLNQVGSSVPGSEAEGFGTYFIAYADLRKAKGLQMLGKNEESLKLTESALARMASTGDRLRLEIAEAYNTASLAAEAIGETGKALRYKSLYVTLYDSLVKKEKLDMINGLEVRYRIAEKDRVLAENQLLINAAAEKVKDSRIAITTVLMLMILLSIIALQWNRRNRQQQKLQKARYDNLQRSMEIERLNAAIAGEDRERSRIARELHDGIGGLLSAAKMNFELVRKKMNGQPNEDLTEGIGLVQEASAELRKTAHNLLPESLLQDGLGKAAEQFCKNLSGKSGTHIMVQQLGTPVNPDGGFSLSVFRIIQELVHNLVKHAHATEALVQLNFRPDQVLDITIEDNGIGFVLSSENEKSSGLGLNSVKKRVRSLNGNIDIQSTQGKGTSIFIELPLSPEHTPAV